jgi:GDSL-like lipase/acylhydrolase family protein
MTACRLPRRHMMVTAAASVLMGAQAPFAKDLPPMNHVVLLGDSVFDNAAYVGGGPDVVTQLRRRLPPGWQASLLAVDGSLISSIAQQLARLPLDASHLVISIGGNDALGHASVLDSPSQSVAESMAQLAVIQKRLHADYTVMIDAVLRQRRPTALCSIYDPRYPDPARRQVSTTALAIINDPIIREAVRRGLPLLDLRIICDQDADFANPIEPSVQGGWKIAGAIASLVSQHDFGRGRSEVYTH